MKDKPNTKLDIKSLKRVLSYVFKGYKFTFAIVIICLILSTVSSVMGNLYLQKLIDNYIIPLMKTENPVYTNLIKAIFNMIIIYMVGVISNLLHSVLMAKISEGTIKQIRDDMFSKMQRLPIRYFDSNTNGDIMSRYTNDTDTLAQMISQGLPQFFTSAITIIVVFVSMLVTNIFLTLVVMVSLGMMLFTTKFILQNSGKFFIKQQEAVGKLNGYIEEMINGQKVVKVFCHEQKAKQDFDKLNEDLCDKMYNANKFSNLLGPVNGAFGNIIYSVVALFGGIFAVMNIGGVSVGLIVSFLQLSKTFVRPINQISQQLGMVVMALAGSKRIFELMDQEPELDDGFVTLVNVKSVNGILVETTERTEKWAWKYIHEDGKVELIELKGHIELENVDFGYEIENPILQDISLYAKPGQKIAFVGATGAGKTTITNLLTRFYDIQKGQIKYDGIDIKKIRKDDLRLSFGMVLQDTNLFTGTIKDNIKYGRDDATDEEVINAAKLANAHEFIEKLPNGYDTVLTGNAASLSRWPKTAFIYCKMCFSRSACYDT